ncbi:cdc42 effector protein 3-like [Myxocyprinus asiaticus]|uniref:cdc42 effector protein 3-like n=1 Tax=Myxocyprinus asiaticus TaxID=70543 RepID=UPI00222220ED|nr:cdc42 effector protein 3-like [Myxocyprinus asiaticus]XP_051508396.1 cdc42 effector protein 3-like [Myxocyprinus asiaticus]XP_051508397.1 cdc42 effector protein 3-like [Myxocyprinus asiaticus]
MPAKTPIYLKSTNSKKGKKCRLRDILSPDMISPPLGDFRHTIHIGKGGECDAFGDMSFLQGRFELLPGKGGLIRPQYNKNGEFTRANSASDASYVETPSPVLKNAISLPSIGGSQALTLPLISTTVFPMTQHPLDNLDEPSSLPAGFDVNEDLEILQMETLFQSVSVFRSDPSPVPEEDEPSVKHLEIPEKSPAKKKIHSSENHLEKFLSNFINEDANANGNFSNGNNQNNSGSVFQYTHELFEVKGDWADRDSGVEEGRLCDSDFEISKSKSHSQESLTQITGSLCSLELDLGPSILDDILNIMNKPVP